MDSDKSPLCGGTTVEEKRAALRLLVCDIELEEQALKRKLLRALNQDEDEDEDEAAVRAADLKHKADILVALSRVRATHLFKAGETEGGDEFNFLEEKK